MKKKASRKRPSRKKNLGKFKSGIEKYCAQVLKANNLKFAYEEKEFTLMDKFRFPHKYFKMTPKKKEMLDRTGKIQQPIRYTPDFMCVNDKWVIETKGYLPSHHDFSMRWKLFLKHILENDLKYMVFLAKNRQQVDKAIEEIKKSISND